MRDHTKKCGLCLFFVEPHNCHWTDRFGTICEVCWGKLISGTAQKLIVLASKRKKREYLARQQTLDEWIGKGEK